MQICLAMPGHSYPGFSMNSPGNSRGGPTTWQFSADGRSQKRGFVGSRRGVRILGGGFVAGGGGPGGGGGGGGGGGLPAPQRLGGAPVSGASIRLGHPLGGAARRPRPGHPPAFFRPQT